MKFTEFLTGKSITADQFKEKSAEEMAGLYNEYNEVTRKSLEDAIEAKATKDDIDGLKAELVANQTLQMKSINEVLKQQGIAIKKLNVEEKAEGKGLLTVRKGLSDHVEGLKALKEGKKESFNFKAVGPMLGSTNVSGGNVPVEQRLAGLDIIASRQIRLMDIVSRGTATSNVISWVSQANKEGAAGQTAEGALKNQIDFDLVVASESLKKTTAFIKVSDEMIDDIDFIESEINNELMREVMKKFEAQVYNGDGQGLNLNGIRTVASAFAAGARAGTVDNANEADVLVVAMEQPELLDQDPASFIFMNPFDVNTLKLIKVGTTDKRYIDRLQIIAGQLSLDGIPIIKSTLVTAGEYLVGAFSNATVYDKGSIMIEVGYDSDDFTKNLRTIRAEVRGLVVVKTNKRPSFVKGVFATDKASLETV